MTSSIGVEIAREHLSDGEDNITDTIKTIRRVLKSFPDLEPALTEATSQLVSARTALQLASLRLQG